MPLINRRNFLKLAGRETLGWSLGASIPLQTKGPVLDNQDILAPHIKTYNSLGNTGLKVSDIGFGAINFLNPNVLRYAYELGVNYFDTAEGYMRTLSESHIGQTLKDIRQKVIISTKHGISAPGEMERNAIIQRIEGSLKRLQTDYIDIALIHQVSEPAILTNEEVLNAYDRLKKDGKIRFTGFSTHVVEKTFPVLLSTSFYDTALFIYNHLEGAAIEPLIDQAQAKGIGTIAMKALAGNKQGSLKSLVNEQIKYSQAALCWVLTNPGIDCCLITMNTFSHVEDYVAASGKVLDRGSFDILNKYKSETTRLYCRISCRDCLNSCPEGVAINDVLRYAMYYEDYHMEKSAVELYGRISETMKPIYCRDCTAPCTGACPFGISIKDRLLHAHRLLMA